MMLLIEFADVEAVVITEDQNIPAGQHGIRYWT